MGKMNELSLVLDGVIEVGTEITEAAKTLMATGEKLAKAAAVIRGNFSSIEEPEQKKVAASNKEETAPDAEPETEQPKDEASEPAERIYTKEEVRKFLAGLSSNGHREEVKALITKHGADNLTQLDPKEYAAVMAEAEAIQNG